MIKIKVKGKSAKTVHKEMKQRQNALINKRKYFGISVDALLLHPAVKKDEDLKRMISDCADDLLKDPYTRAQECEDLKSAIIVYVENSSKTPSETVETIVEITKWSKFEKESEKFTDKTFEKLDNHDLEGMYKILEEYGIEGRIADKFIQRLVVKTMSTKEKQTWTDTIRVNAAKKGVEGLQKAEKQLTLCNLF